MSKVVMKPFFMMGCLQDENRVLESLQMLNCVELIDQSKGNIEYDFSDDLDKLINKVAKIGNVLEKFKTFLNFKRSFFNFKRVESVDSLSNIKKNEVFLFKQLELIDGLIEQSNQNSAKISKLRACHEKIRNFIGFDGVLKNFETKFTNCFLCETSQRVNLKQLSLMFNEVGAYFEIVNSGKFNTVVFVVVLKKSYDVLKQNLLNYKFSLVNFDRNNLNVCESLNFYNSEIEKLKLDNDECFKKLNFNERFVDDFELLFDYLNLKLNRKKQLLNFKRTKHTFCLEGFLNPEKESAFLKIVNKFGLFLQFFNSNVNSPVDFKNYSVVSAVEDVTRTYSMPSNVDVDPNPFMAFFYYLFFGIMFSDAGYGILMAVFCSFFAFSKKVDLQNRNKFKMFFFCGISTTFWGFMFGSFFGNFTEIFSKIFLGLKFSLSPIFIDTLNEPMKLLCFSLFLGFLQIFVGMLIKFFVLIKNNKFKDAFFIELNWIFLMLGAGVVFLSLFLRLLFFKLIGFVFLGLGMLGVVFFSGYKSKGVMKLVSGLINLYGATSYVGDVLSYCRLMALAIATGVVAGVVNLLSTMLCGNFFGFLAFLLVFIFGHAMNFGINALGAYVHTVRLQYVEFFSKFYEGGGRLFKPFGLCETKFVEFVD